MWLPHKPSERLVFLWQLVWLQSISPLPQPHQVAAQLSSVNQTHCDPAALQPPEGTEVSLGAFGLTAKMMGSLELFQRTLVHKKKIKEVPLSSLIWKRTP